MARDGDTRPLGGPLYNPRSGHTEHPTELVESTDPALLRLHLRRLAEQVDTLVDREARRVAEPAPHADLLWAVRELERRVTAGEQWGRTRDRGALVVAACVVAWTGLCTALAAGAFVWAVTQ